MLGNTFGGIFYESIKLDSPFLVADAIVWAAIILAVGRVATAYIVHRALRSKPAEIGSI